MNRNRQHLTHWRASVTRVMRQRLEALQYCMLFVDNELFVSALHSYILLYLLSRNLTYNQSSSNVWLFRP